MKFFEGKFVNNKDLSSFGAFSCDDKALFKLKIPRKCGAQNVCMHIFGEGIDNNLYKRIDFKWESIDTSFDIYTSSVDMSEIGVGLYYYKYEINSTKSIFLGVGSQSGELSVINDGQQGLIQLLVYKEDSSCANWMHGGIMYHIFVDRFKKSG